jgi:hypothetical protein
VAGLAACSSSGTSLDATDSGAGGMDAQPVKDSGTGGGRDALPSDSPAPDVTGAPDLGMPPPDTGLPSPDTGIQDATNPDATNPDAAPPDSGPPDSGIFGPIGSEHNPAPSCKVILQMIPTATSGPYFILPTSTTATAALHLHNTYCDMTTDQGGWTKIAGFTEGDVDAVKGRTAKEMLKCSDTGVEYIESPTATLAWSWGGLDRFRQVPGMWKVNDQMQPCDSNPEYTQYTCGSWWGWGCGNGGGNQNKLFPGVLDQPSAGFCADTTSAHTNLTFSICTNSNGPDNYRTYSVFIRSDQ